MNLKTNYNKINGYILLKNGKIYDPFLGLNKAADILIKDGGTIGVASSTSAITIASSGIVTLVDDLILKDAATIGVTSSTSAISIASTGIVTLVDDLILKDAATIGVTSATSAISIASTGIWWFGWSMWTFKSLENLKFDKSVVKITLVEYISLGFSGLFKTFKQIRHYNYRH